MSDWWGSDDPHANQVAPGVYAAPKGLKIQRDVAAFHKALGLVVRRDLQHAINQREVMLRTNLILEEVGELLRAMGVERVELGKDLGADFVQIGGRDQDIEKVADGIVDSIVVLVGTAIHYGIDLEPVWDEIQRSNLAKAGGGKRADGKVLKPEGWEPPNVRKALGLED